MESVNPLINETPEIPKYINLLTKENTKVSVEVDVIRSTSETIKNQLIDIYDGETIDIPVCDIEEATLVRIIAYCKEHYKDAPPAEDDEFTRPPPITEFDRKFTSEVELPALLQLIVAVNHLSIKNLLFIATKEVADRMKREVDQTTDKSTEASVEALRKFFDIKRDYNDAEYEKAKEEVAWCFETKN